MRTDLKSNPVKTTPAPVVFNGTAVELPVNGNGNNGAEIKLLPKDEEVKSTKKPESNNVATMV